MAAKASEAIDGDEVGELTRRVGERIASFEERLGVVEAALKLIPAMMSLGAKPLSKEYSVERSENGWAVRRMRDGKVVLVALPNEKAWREAG